MIMNVPSAPEMQGTPMAPDLSMEMQPDMADVSQAEMQEAQGALMQILQVINMLIEQGLNEEQIRAFLEQYGISEDELDQAAQALGVDIDAVLSGQMQAPQEPMMMAAGGPSIFELQKSDPENIRKIAMANPGDFIGGSRLSDQDIMMARQLLAEMEGMGITKTQEEIQEILKRRLAPKSKSNMMPPMMMAGGGPGRSQEQPQPQQLAFGMINMSDNEPMMQERSRENQIFTLQSQINNLMNDYNIAVRDQDFDTAQAIADQINNIDVAITQLQSQMPMGLGQKKN